MDDLITEFIAETRDMLDALGGEIIAWEAAPADRSRLDEIFRFVHTVKGNCGFFDLPRIRGLSHAAENVLTDLRSGKRAADPALVSAVLAIIDRIGELVQELESGETLASGDDEQLIAALDQEAGETKGETAATTSMPSIRSNLRSIRLPVDLLDRVMSGVSDLVLARNELARCLRESGYGAGVEAAFDRVSATIGEIRDAITHTRMQRIDNLFATLPRLARDVADELGKKIALEIEGGDVELDREMIEMIRDPLTHIIRNAIDHGIEDEAVRREAGKPATGNIRIAASQAGNQILIEIADDGRGIDGDKLVARAMASGLLSQNQADRLSAAQRTALIFEPGLSTAGQVTAISGRGVGMDVVRANVERIGGLIDIDNRPGLGLRLTLRVPLTLTIIPALTVQLNGQSYAVPRSTIEEIVRVKGGAVAIESLGGSSIATIRGRRLPLVSLGAALGVTHQEATEDQCLIVLRPAGTGIYALAVDKVSDHEELVVKPAAPAVMATGLYGGTTLADDGRPILLLDPPGIAATAGIALEAGTFDTSFASTATAAPEADAKPALLFMSLCGVKRIVPLSAVERIEDVPSEAVQISAGRLHIALGDSILRLQGCGAEAAGRAIRILRLSDGINQVAYGIGDVVDIVPLGTDILPAATEGEVRGVTLIGGEQVEVLDLFHLFEGSATSEPEGARRICAIPAEDHWMETILGPVIESAGYRIVRAGDPGAEMADIHLVNSDEISVKPCIKSGRVVKICSDPEKTAGDAIHRYDRSALLDALADTASGRKSRA
ncbi:chemotaxis protein CheA [Sphingosinicella rhizophila]|uniref:histidine kinase n=1 Tax=Sphingosinicella rhizophila TaxID=3050082 RepID=A0ABU3Q298_9SPHN|nr:chemotaxis protein CheA [Sphingosinicella sp. GR2756]MDT9597546.1 chemotaxis protein CheA [Sphingosinicella sp. GR2756]